MEFVWGCNVDLVAGYSYKFFVNKGNPNNKTLHVRALVDNKVVYATCNQVNQMYYYYIDDISLFINWIDRGWLKKTGKTKNSLPEIEKISRWNGKT